jgi:hypothetical protein
VEFGLLLVRGLFFVYTEIVAVGGDKVEAVYTYVLSFLSACSSAFKKDSHQNVVVSGFFVSHTTLRAG